MKTEKGAISKKKKIIKKLLTCYLFLQSMYGCGDTDLHKMNTKWLIQNEYNKTATIQNSNKCSATMLFHITYNDVFFNQLS